MIYAAHGRQWIGTHAPNCGKGFGAHTGKPSPLIPWHFQYCACKCFFVLRTERAFNMTYYRFPNIVEDADTFDADLSRRLAFKYGMTEHNFFRQSCKILAATRVDSTYHFVRAISRWWFFSREEFPAPQYSIQNGRLIGQPGTASAFISDCLSTAGVIYPEQHLPEIHDNVCQSIQNALEYERYNPGSPDELDRKSRGATVQE